MINPAAAAAAADYLSSPLYPSNIIRYFVFSHVS
jgi:hypothetical protein